MKMQIFTAFSGLNAVAAALPSSYSWLFKTLVQTSTYRNRNHVIQSFANYLDETTYMNAFNYSKNFSGATSPRPRWKRILDSEESSMGELLGQLFAKEYFNEKAKKRYSDLVEAIRTAYVERINNLTWMSTETKAKALEKLGKVSKKVGYPDQWKDFSSLKIDRQSYLDNKINSNLFWHQYNINKLNKPVDRTEWDMTPQTYNAYYNPSNNEIVLPAGIFAVPGVKDEDLDDAFVYGYAAASTIGHEITHGFDDQGRQYDAKGNLSDWWTAEDAKNYTERATCVEQQFSDFRVEEVGMNQNGKLVLGESIGDLGGLKIAWLAFQKSLQGKPRPANIDGFTPEQRFFLGWAQVWGRNQRTEAIRQQLLTDPHPLGRFRVNGPLSNMPQFAEAFSCKLGDKMVRPEDKRCQVW